MGISPTHIAVAKTSCNRTSNAFLIDNRTIHGLDTKMIMVMQCSKCGATWEKPHCMACFVTALLYQLCLRLNFQFELSD